MQRIFDSIDEGVVNVIIDTNFLLIPGVFNVDIFSEIDRIIHEKYKIWIVDKTLDELDSIIKSKTHSLKDKIAARIGKQLLSQRRVFVLKTKSFLNTHKTTLKSSVKNPERLSVDDIILLVLKTAMRTKSSSSEKIKFLVATQDKDLKRRVKSLGFKTLSLRKKKYLVIN